MATWTYNGTTTVSVTFASVIGQDYSLFCEDGSSTADATTAVSTSTTLTVTDVAAAAGTRFAAFVTNDLNPFAAADYTAASTFKYGTADEFGTTTVWTYDGVDTVTVTFDSTLGVNYLLQGLDKGQGGFDSGIVAGTGASLMLTATAPGATTGDYLLAELYLSADFTAIADRLFTSVSPSAGFLGSPGGGADPSAPVGRVLIALTSSALEPDPDWTRIDDTPNLISGYDIHTGRQTEFDQTEVGTATVYVNDTAGLFDPSNTLSPYFGLLDGKQILLQLYDPVAEEWEQQWRGIIDDFEFEHDPSGLVSNIQIECVDKFEYLAGVEMIPGSFGDTPPAGSERTVFYEDGDVQTRITQLLADAGLDSDTYRVFTGNVDVQETKYDAGDSLLIALRDAADAEFPTIANLYVDRLGRFIFHGRKARFDPETTMIGTDWDFTRWKAGDGAAITLDPDRAQIRPPLKWTRPRSRIVNAALSWPRGIKDADMAGQIVIDATSIAAYGYRSWSATDLIIQSGTTTGNTADEECQLFDSYMVANYKDPRTRVESLTFKSLNPEDPRAAATWALICRADISDVINLEHGYPGGVGISEDFYIEGYEKTVRPLQGEDYDLVEVSYNVTPASYYSDDVFA